MTDARRHAIIARMRALAIAAALVLLAPAALAEDREYDLGFARPGMMQGQFRYGAWPAGVKVFCSDDKDRPEELDKAGFALPKGIARMGASRCGLFAEDKDGWRPYRLETAGWSTELWGLFFPDGAGTPRLVQLYLTQPAEAFDSLYRAWTDKLGPPTEKRAKLARWSNARNDAAIIHDGGASLHAYLVDNRLQAAMNARMQQPAAKR